MNNMDYVTASEIGEYVYCKRAWWLRCIGFAETTSQMKAGTIKHTNLARFLRIMKTLIFITTIILLFAFLMFLVSFFF